MESGIYQIKNKMSGKVYVGSSIDIKKRFYKHLWLLKNNKHDNNHLQNSFNLDGESSFEFSILEYCNETELVLKENHYINLFNSCSQEFGYNMSTVNEFRRNCFNNEVKIKLSKYNLKKNNNFSQFSLTNIDTGEIFIFDSLVDGANYLISNGFAKGNPRNVRMRISTCLRGVKVDNGYKGSIRKTCYKHYFKIIN